MVKTVNKDVDIGGEQRRSWSVRDMIEITASFLEIYIENKILEY